MKMISYKQIVLALVASITASALFGAQRPVRVGYEDLKPFTYPTIPAQAPLSASPGTVKPQVQAPAQVAPTQIVQNPVVSENPKTDSTHAAQPATPQASSDAKASTDTPYLTTPGTAEKPAEAPTQESPKAENPATATSPAATPDTANITPQPTPPAQVQPVAPTPAAPPVAKTRWQRFKELFSFQWRTSTPHPASPSATPGRQSAPPSTPSTEKTEPVLEIPKTKLQKIKTFSGALLRGMIRGGLTGAGSLANATPAGHYAGNLDAATDLALDFGQIRGLAELISDKIDDTNQVTEEVTAALVHALIPLITRVEYKNPGSYAYDRRAGIETFCATFVSRLVKLLDTRNATKLRKISTLIVRFVTESININGLASKSDQKYIFRPFVGIAAVVRTLLVDKIITKREADGKITTPQELRRTQRLLNGTLGMVLSMMGNLFHAIAFNLQ